MGLTRYLDKWRWFLALLICIFVISGCIQQDDNAFKRQFIAYSALFIDDGRVVDTGNNDVSHSEGQGYGLLFAVHANEQQTFDALWAWTKDVLQRDDALFHWRFTPCTANDRTCIDDPNNASDGDTLIAWALLRAYEKWGNTEYRSAAKRIVAAIEKTLIVQYEGYTLLLPGEYGFRDDSSIQLNLSYWLFPAFIELKTLSENPSIWEKLSQSGDTLIDIARFSEYHLPSDWVRLTPTGVTLADTISQDYGFNAVRIPLHAAWGGIISSPIYSDFAQWWNKPNTPATLNLLNSTASEYLMTPGMLAVESAVNTLIFDKPYSSPNITRRVDYYSASLILLSTIAVEGGR